MSLGAVDTTNIGGGYGGFGGGIAPVGLFGVIGGFGRDGFGRDGHGHDGCGCKCQEIISDLTNRNVDSVREQVNRNSLAAEIAGLTGRIQSQLGEMGTRAEIGNVRIADKLCCVDKDVNNINFQMALLAKDQLASDAACCCKLENAIHSEGEKTRALIECNFVKELEGKLATKTLELSQCKQNELWLVLSNKVDGFAKEIANTNVNFGTQITQLTSAVNSLVSKG